MHVRRRLNEETVMTRLPPGGAPHATMRGCASHGGEILARRDSPARSEISTAESDDASFRRRAYWAVGVVATLIVASLVSAICSIAVAI